MFGWQYGDVCAVYVSSNCHQAVYQVESFCEHHVLCYRVLKWCAQAHLQFHHRLHRVESEHQILCKMASSDAML